MIQPTRRTQPYRVGPRMPGPALDAMLKGRTAHGMNVADVKRAGFLVDAAKRANGRKRPARPQRPPRPAR